MFFRMPWRHDGNMAEEGSGLASSFRMRSSNLCRLDDDRLFFTSFPSKAGIFWLFPDTRVTWPNWQRCFSVYWVNVCVCQNGYWKLDIKSYFKKKILLYHSVYVMWILILAAAWLKNRIRITLPAPNLLLSAHWLNRSTRWWTFSCVVHSLGLFRDLEWGFQ